MKIIDGFLFSFFIFPCFGFSLLLSLALLPLIAFLLCLLRLFLLASLLHPHVLLLDVQRTIVESRWLRQRRW